MVMRVIWLAQGDQADCMYFIEHGKVRIVAKKKVCSVDTFILACLWLNCLHDNIINRNSWAIVGGVAQW